MVYMWPMRYAPPPAVGFPRRFVVPRSAFADVTVNSQIVCAAIAVLQEAARRVVVEEGVCGPSSAVVTARTAVDR